MRNIILKPWTRVCAALSLAIMASQAQAQTVTTIGGGYTTAPYQGYQDGTTLQARFNQPSGLAMDPSATYLFVADCSNNAVRIITSPGVSGSATMTLSNTFVTSVTRGISHPVSVIVDSATNIYVLNRGNSTNGTLLEFNAAYIGYPSFVATNASLFTNATAMAMDNFNNIYVTAYSNTVYKVSPSNTVSVVGTVLAPGTRLQGIAVLDNGNLALSDAGTNSGIWTMTPTNGTYTALAGFNGIGDNSDNWPVPATYAVFNRPGNIAKAGNGMLVIADQGNNRVKLLDTSGNSVSLLYGVKSNYWGNPQTSTDKYPGWLDGQSGTLSGYAESRLPYGIVIAPDGTVFASEDYYHILRHITSTGLTGPPPPPPQAPANLTATVSNQSIVLKWSSAFHATSYNVKRAQSSTTNLSFTTIANVAGTTYVDSGLQDGSTWYYVVTALGDGGESPSSSVVTATLPYLAVQTPVIGYITFPYGGAQFNPVYTSVTLNNDVPIVIESADGTQTFFTYSNTPDISAVPDPTASSASAPSGYTNGVVSVDKYEVASIEPALSIKAIGEETNHPSSQIAKAQFFFVVGNPNIVGNNAAQFSLTDITTGAHLYYTIDGSDPSSTNPAATDLGVLAGTNTAWTISFPITTNTLFKVIGYRDNYQPSTVVSNLFTPSGFQPSSISFGFAAGEASSDFVASPGQTFYAPVTLSTLPNTTIYSMQFALTVTNAGPNPGPAITPGAFGFQSMLMKPDSDGTLTPIPPLMFVGDDTGPVNPSQLVTYGGTNFVDLETVNSALNLMTVGWVERYTETNLYNTLKQDLIAESMAHDDLFLQAGNRIIVGGYAFQVPANAVTNQTYQIQIIRPSATSDGIGAAGSDVYISAPTNGATAGGAPVNALKYVTVGQRKYIAGSVYPFRWFNAGDFGSSNIVNADVEQVFQSAIYQLNNPPDGSDFFDGMDSCGSIGVLDSDPADPNNTYYTNSYTATATGLLFSGDDTTINQVTFGDGVLDVCDVYVTFRRSLDPSLTWFRRFWNNGQRVADTGAANIANHSLKVPKALNTTSVASQANFSAGDVTGSAGQTVQIPINVTVLGNYPLRVLMLNLSVVPLDGAPALTSPVSFNQIATTLGAPYTTTSDGNGNYAAVWLNSTNSGLTGTVTLGTLSVTIPSTASGTAAYAIHFDHASASPNGIGSFSNQKFTGLLTTSSYTNSTYGDGIPDSWRLRWFGTVYNVLSASNACPSGDGVPNWKKYVAGVDPNVANDFPSVNSKTPVPSGSTTAIHWPSVQGKQYVIQRSISLFGTPWTVLSTNTGTGGDMEFDDNSTAPAKFYRVQILP